MISLKIAATGLLVFMLAGWVISAVEEETLPLPLVVTLLTVFLGGLSAAVGGFLWWVWS